MAFLFHYKHNKVVVVVVVYLMFKISLLPNLKSMAAITVFNFIKEVGNLLTSI